jgi:hypothetical protein
MPCPYDRCTFHYFNNVYAPELNNALIFFEISVLTAHLAASTNAYVPVGSHICWIFPTSS